MAWETATSRAVSREDVRCWTRVRGCPLCLVPHIVASRGLLGGGWQREAGLTGLAGIAIAIGTYSTAIAVAGTAGAAIGTTLVYLTLSLLTWRLLHNRLTPKNHSHHPHPAPIKNSAPH